MEQKKEKQLCNIAVKHVFCCCEPTCFIYKNIDLSEFTENQIKLIEKYNDHELFDSPNVLNKNILSYYAYNYLDFLTGDLWSNSKYEKHLFPIKENDSKCINAKYKLTYIMC